jgi:hypothetical protein
MNIEDVNHLNYSGLSSMELNPLAYPRLLSRLDVANNIGDEGAKALADYLKPHENPDGSWCQNQVLQKLYLQGVSSSLPLPLFFPLEFRLFLPPITHVWSMDTEAVDHLNSCGPISLEMNPLASSRLQLVPR